MTYGTFVSFFLQTQGKYEFTLTEYESYSDFEHNVTGTAISTSSFSLGLKLTGIFELGYSSTSNIGQHFISRIKRFSHTVGTVCLLFHSYVFFWIFISTDVCILYCHWSWQLYLSHWKAFHKKYLGLTLTLLFRKTSQWWPSIIIYSTFLVWHCLVYF